MFLPIYLELCCIQDTSRCNFFGWNLENACFITSILHHFWLLLNGSTEEHSFDGKILNFISVYPFCLYTCVIIGFFLFRTRMKFLGIEFAPVNIPLERRLQTVGVLQWVLSFLFLGFGCLIFTIYLLFTRFYFISLAYLVWYIADRKTSARGGRRILWVQKWKIWEYFRDYFPIELVKTTELDPKKNYIFSIHPHGVLSTSAFLNFATEATDFRGKFPGLQANLMVLPGHFTFPFYREYFMAAGMVMN